MQFGLGEGHDAVGCIVTGGDLNDWVIVSQYTKCIVAGVEAWLLESRYN